jgi:aspartate/methionine/tyrosine aminotransferase
LNSPSNPTGKVFTKEEYLKIAEILREFPKVLVIKNLKIFELLN